MGNHDWLWFNLWLVCKESVNTGYVIQWNLDITKSSVKRTNFERFLTVKYMKKNLDLTKPRKSQQILQIPWSIVISRFHSYTKSNQRIVTSSSEDVGWIATVASKSFFVAPILTATEKPCSISSQPIPKMCSPMTWGKRREMMKNENICMKETWKTILTCRFVKPICTFCTQQYVRAIYTWMTEQHDLHVQLEIMKTNNNHNKNKQPVKAWLTRTSFHCQGKPKNIKKDVIHFASPFLPVEGKQASSVFPFCAL